MEKRLYRSRKNKVIFGLVGGLAQYFNIDASLLRVLWLIFTFLGIGGLFIVYIIAYFVVPLEPEMTNTENK